jgi:cell division protein FtsB
MGRATLRLLKVALYAALIGLFLASYVTPLQEILANKVLISDLRADLAELENDNISRQRAVEELETPEGVERVARERYGMIEPGEQVYIVSDDER